jgi:predicted lipid carrier protein YhbT
MAGLTMLILGLLLGACQMEIPVDLNKMMMTQADLVQQEKELTR